MTVWCGQCQTRNEGDAVRCVQCGAPLKPTLPRATQERPSPAVSRRHGDHVAAGRHLRLYDPSGLARLLEEQHANRLDLLPLLSACRVAVRCVPSDGGGSRVYFLPERPSSYFPVPEDSVTLHAEDRTLTVSVVHDAARPLRKAVYYVESTPLPLSAASDLALARYEHLWRDKRHTQALLWLLPLVFAVFATAVSLIIGRSVTLGSGSPAGDVSAGGVGLAYATSIFGALALGVYTTLFMRSLVLRLRDRDESLRGLEVAMGCAPNSLPSGVDVASHSGTAVTTGAAEGLLGLPLAVSIVLAWLLGRVVFSGAGAVAFWEPALLMLVALALHPAVLAALHWRQQRPLGDARREWALRVPEGAECSFEPWVQQER